MNHFITASLVSSCLAFTGVAAGACSRSPERDPESSKAPWVAVVRAARGDVSRVLTVTAEFRPFQEIEVHAKVAGYVRSMLVDVGDRVKAGQLLAVLEVPELVDEVRQDEAAVQRALQEINRAQADLERTQSAHEVAHLAATRLADVMKARPNLVAQQDIDEATGRDRVAEAQIATAQAALAAARQQLAMAKAAQNKASTLLAYAQITAPFAGIITHRYADTGAMIQAGTASNTQAMPVVRLSENSRLRLVIPVPESVVTQIHIGTPVGLTVQSPRRVIRGTVARFSDRLDIDTRTMHVEVDVPNRDLALVPGMYVEASIVLNEAKDVLVAPVDAIDRAGKTPYVFVVNRDHRIEPHPVTVGVEASDRVELASGVSVNNLLVVGNHSQLRAGTRVNPKVVREGTDGTTEEAR